MNGMTGIARRARWRAPALLLAFVLAGAGAAWSSGAAAHVAPRRHVVEMRGFKFVPERIQAAVGDTIVWINRDIAPHTATAKAGKWDTGNVAAQAQARTVVARKGVQAFLCVYHPTMKGVLIVA